MQIKYFIRTTCERVLDESINRELGENYTLLVDKEHDSAKAFFNQLLEINDYDAILLEDDIILCKNFKKRIEEVINKYPNEVINFFTNPCGYFETKYEYFFCYNQCTFYPKGFSKILYDKIVECKLEYSRQELMIRTALTKLRKKHLVYRPCLVQHIDNESLMGHNVNFCRRSPFFIDYLEELNIDYKDAWKTENKEKLINLMKEKFKESV